MQMRQLGQQPRLYRFRNQQLGQLIDFTESEQKPLVTVGIAVDTPTTIKLGATVALGTIAGMLVIRAFDRYLYRV